MRESIGDETSAAGTGAAFMRLNRNSVCSSMLCAIGNFMEDACSEWYAGGGGGGTTRGKQCTEVGNKSLAKCEHLDRWIVLNFEYRAWPTQKWIVEAEALHQPCLYHLGQSFDESYHTTHRCGT